MTDETKAFQRWVVDHLMPSEFSHNYLFKVDEDGDYVLDFVMDFWDGWQARAALAQPQSLTGCLHPIGQLSCHNQGGCQSEACVHYNKTEYRPRMTVLARVDGILYPKGNADV